MIKTLKKKGIKQMKKKLSIFLFSLLSLSCSEKKEKYKFRSEKMSLHRSIKGKKISISKIRNRRILGILNASSSRKTEMKIQTH